VPADAPDGNPYVGPRPFERGDALRFFGRERETRDLASVVVAHRVVVLYSASGAGKSSLLNAGVIPQLVAKGFDVLPPGRLGVLPPRLRPQETLNVFTASLVAQWAAEDVPADELGRMSLAGFLRDRPRAMDEEGEPAPRALMLDQFEELFTAHAERRDDRRAFVEELRDALDEDPGLRVVLALREEYLAPLDPYLTLLPGAVLARFRLERLDRPNALAALTHPLEATQHGFDEGAAEALVDDLLKLRVEVDGRVIEVTGDEVEPVQLQVVGRQLWSELPANVSLITKEHLRAFADLDSVLGLFYDDAVSAATGKRSVREARIRSWVADQLVTAGGTRSTVYRGAESTAGLPNEAVETLQAKRLVRAEERAGALWYELTHDRLIGPIRASNERFFVRRGRRRLRLAVGSIPVLVLVAAVVVYALRPGLAPGPGFVTATLTPQVINFGSIDDPLASRPQVLTFASGSQSRVLHVAPGRDGFSVDDGCPVRVAARRSCTISVSFKPVALGPAHANLRIAVEGGGTLAAALRGTLTAPAGGGSSCGIERWDVKTLQDPAASRVSLDPQAMTVTGLTELKASPPSSGAARNAPIEFTTYRVRARLLAMSIQEDSDIKLIVGDPAGGPATMAVELPAPACVLRASSSFQASMRRARDAVVTACGTPPVARYTNVTGVATITGVGFLDLFHRQRGAAKNGIELHPALALTDVTCGTEQFQGAPGP
jgi:Fe2+ transport system protein FeoA